MNTLLILVLSLFLNTNDFKLSKSIEVKGDFITVDELGNIYIVDYDKLSKFDIKGNLLKTYDNKAAGGISFVDVSDPLKILLFHKDFSQIVFLDNTLSITGESIYLNKFAMEEATLSCSSYENAFWLYKPQDAELLRFDNSLKITHRSGNISQITGTEINPNYLIEYNNFVYLNDPEAGIMVFDRYGAYLKTIPVKGLDYFQIIDDRLLYIKDKAIKVYNMKTLDEKYLELPENNFIKALLWQDKLYILKKGCLNIYTIN